MSYGCLIAICFMSFALCYVLINCFTFFNYSFYLFLVLYVLLSICVFCVFVLFCVLFLPMYKVVYFLFVYNFTHHCHRVETQLHLISYHIISYQKFRTELSLTFQIFKKKKFTVNWRRLEGLEVVHTADVNYSIES